MRRLDRRLAAGVALFALGAVGLLAGPPLGWAQGRNRQAQSYAENVPYDGRFTFARIRYSEGEGGFRRGDSWAHDYPRGERHFTKILSELSTIRVRTQDSNILALDDPELFKYPVAYMCEAGFWRPSDAEALGLRNYLLKGGFIIFDDFARNDWFNFESQMRRVLPELRAMRLTPQDKVFDSFYHITDLTYFHPYYGMPSEFWGYYENNDRSQRLLAIVNFNNDLSEHWEFSDEGFFPLEASNEAYKLGVNYLIHALTR
jgi:hypothetical protein